MENFNSVEACKAQKKLQEKKNYPAFAPSDGVCYSCRNNIYKEIDRGSHKTGISVGRATVELITGCPHCHYSYCE